MDGRRLLSYKTQPTVNTIEEHIATYSTQVCDETPKGSSARVFRPPGFFGRYFGKFSDEGVSEDTSRAFVLEPRCFC